MSRARRPRVARSVWRALLLACLAPPACVPPLDGANAPCPCDSAHECCPTVEEDQCVPRGQLSACRIAAVCPLPDGTPPDFALLAGSPDGTTAAPLLDGGRLPLYFGVQGGFHVYLQLAMARLDPRALRVTRRLLEPSTGRELRYQSETLAFQCQSGAWELGQGELTYVCPPEVAGVAVHDVDLTLEVTLADAASGLSLTKRFTIHPFCQTSDHYDLCVGSNQGCGG